MPFLRNADLPASEQEDEPLIAGIKSLYAQLFCEFQAKVTQGESLILTVHCYMVNGCILSNVASGQRIGQGKRNTLEAISELIDLNFDQFRRSVLLAQGDFAAFLKAKKMNVPACWNV